MKNHILFSIIGIMLLLLSCATRHDNFFRGDVIGFSDKPTTSYRAERGLFMNLKPQSPPYNLLDGNGTSQIRTDIKTVPRGNNTTAYYAMELAAKRVNYIRRKIAQRDPLTKYYIFLLTDGLDNASSQVAKNEKRILFNRTPKQYQKRVHRQLKNAMGWFSKNTFEVYPMMYEGEDLRDTKERNKLTDAQFKEMLKQDMECFRYSSEGKEKAPELISADNFQSIITELRSHFEKNSYTFRIPKGYAGKMIRMNFVNSQNQEVTLTAKLKKSLFSYFLTDIKLSDGATIQLFKANNSLKATNLYTQDNINVYFDIHDLQLNGIAYMPQVEKVTQEYEFRSGIWQPNSEYREVTKTAINTYFVLVIDGSKSLDGKNNSKDGFKEETDMALKIMEILSPRY